MTILAIRVMGDPVLRTPADPVTRFDATLARLCADMHQTMDEVDGVGLAAPQVGTGLRVFVYHVGEDRGTVCNPCIDLSPAEGLEPDDGSEGCLSVPGLGFRLPRPAAVTLTGVDEHGDALRIEATGLLARCLQHETDHLDGKLYVDRLTGEARRQAFSALRDPRFTEHAGGVSADRARSVSSAFGSVTSAPGNGSPAAAAPGSSFGRTAPRRRAEP